jgi:hypothetical protein
VGFGLFVLLIFLVNDLLVLDLELPAGVAVLGRGDLWHVEDFEHDMEIEVVQIYTF